MRRLAYASTGGQSLSAPYILKGKHHPRLGRVAASPSAKDEMKESVVWDLWSKQGLEEVREGSQIIPHFSMDTQRKTSFSNS